MRKIYVFLLAVLPVSLCVRVLAVVFAIDPVTGFYKNNYLVYIQNGILIAFFAALILICFLPKFADSKNQIHDSFTVFKLILSLIACVGFSFSIYYGLFVNTDMALAPLLLLVFAALSIAAFLLISFIVKGFNKLTGLLMLFVVGYSFVKLIITFMRFTTISNISTYLFDVLMDIAVLLFCFVLAKGMAVKPNNKLVFLYGFAAGLFIVISSGANLWLTLNSYQTSVFIEPFSIKNSAYLFFLPLILYYTYKAAVNISFFGNSLPEKTPVPAPEVRKGESKGGWHTPL